MVDPKHTSRACSRCGGRLKLRKEQALCPSCGLRINRQLNAAINVYLRCGAVGVAPNGIEGRDLPDELVRAESLMTSKFYLVPTSSR